MAVRSKSSHKWLQEHHRDQYVKRAQTDGYRSRASYKLIEINQKDKIFKPGLIVVDLGAAPGGWSQVAAKLVGPGGKIIASDILNMDPIDKVDFVLGDFTNSVVLQNILDLLDNNIPLEKIMLRGGWKSEASAMRYLQSWNDSNWLIVN